MLQCSADVILSRFANGSFEVAASGSFLSDARPVVHEGDQQVPVGAAKKSLERSHAFGNRESVL